MIRPAAKLRGALLLVLVLVSGSCSNSQNDEATLAWCDVADTIRLLPSPDLLASSTDVEIALTFTDIEVQKLPVVAPSETADASRLVADAYANLDRILAEVQWDGLDIRLADYRPVVNAEVAEASRSLDDFDQQNCAAISPDAAQPLALWERILVAGMPEPGAIADDATFRDVLVANVVGEVEMNADQRDCVRDGITLETLDRLLEVLTGCDVSFG